MIKILTDTASDYFLDEAKEKGIVLAKMSISIDGTEYIEGENITREGFYEKLISTDSFPQTSQPSPEAFERIFTEAKEAGDELICILISSGFSGTLQSAMIAKDMVDYDKIYLIDSQAATFCLKIMADYGLKLIDEGLTAPEIVEKIEEIKPRVRCVAALDTLEYLYKGGRLSKASAAIGEAVNIKPVITFEDGKIKVNKKCLGKKQALVHMGKVLQELEVDEEFPLYTLYSLGTEYTEKLGERFERLGFQVDKMMQIGSTIGTHIGPEAFGAVFVSRK